LNQLPRTHKGHIILTPTVVTLACSKCVTKMQTAKAEMGDTGTDSPIQGLGSNSSSLINVIWSLWECKRRLWMIHGPLRWLRGNSSPFDTEIRLLLSN